MKTNPYVDYARLDTLHDLQRPRTGESAELSFIVTTQVMELLFGLLAHEWEQARDALVADDLDGAVAVLRRGLHVQDVLVSSWDLLATMTPVEYARFRDALGDASGMQSVVFHRLERLLGTAKGPEPSLYDAALGLLERHGIGGRDEPLKTWRVVYESHPELVPFAELLVDVAERSQRWRQRHYTAVRRAMGAKPGTGGSAGLAWLKAALDRDAFPELWAVRGEL
ncbi:tryptophan 2,3-dioxygenase [Actinocorallia lasiicapitis]